MSKALPRKLIHAKVTMGGVPMTYTFSCRVDHKEANIKYVYHKNEQTGKTVTSFAQSWSFSRNTWHYEAITTAYKEKESNWLANFAFNLFQCSQIASSAEMMRIATEAINNAVAEKEKANAESANEASDRVVEKLKKKRTSKKKSDEFKGK